MNKLIVFDLDGIVADSKSSIDVEMAQLTPANCLQNLSLPR